MRMLRRFLPQLAALLLVVTIAGACGDDDADTGASGPGTTNTTEQATTTSAPREAAGMTDEDTDADVGDATSAELGGVHIEITSDSAGLDLQFSVAAADVREAANPAMVWIVCSGATSSNPGLLSGLYFVTAFDRFRESGLRHVGIESYDEVHGPGTYRGVVEVSDSAGRFVSVEGQLTINADGRSGVLVGADDDGNDMTVAYRCEV